MPEQTAALARDSVQELGGAFAEDPKTLRRARQLGLTGWAFYVAGRGGALGDVRPDTVAAALGFISAEAVHDGWDTARRVTSPSQVAEQHLAECCRWGREKLDGYPSVGRLIELTERIVVGADAAGLTLFGAWRSMPIPDDGPGAHAAVLAKLLLEHRSAAHLVAIRAAGMSPLEALIASAEGEAAAVAYGWQPPYPPVAPLLRKRIRADTMTDRIVGEAYGILDVTERAELLRLLAEAAAQARVPTAEYPAVSQTGGAGGRTGR
jgi:helix-turn-helix protein